MKLLSGILSDPTKAYINIKRFTSETLFTLIYGKGFGNDEELRTVLHILETFIQDMHPFAHVVDRLPVLDWLPDVLAPWRVEARKKGQYEFQVGVLCDAVELFSPLLAVLQPALEGCQGEDGRWCTSRVLRSQALGERGAARP